MRQVFISGLREAGTEVGQFKDVLARAAGQVRVFEPSTLFMGPDYLHSLEAELDKSGLMLSSSGQRGSRRSPM